MNQEKHLLYKEYFEWIETYKRGSVSRATYQKFESVGKYLEEEYPLLYLEDMSRTKFQQMVNKYGDRHVFASTKDFREKVSHVLRQAYYDGLVKKDPTYRVVTASTVKAKKTKKYLEENEVKQLVSVLKKHDDFYAKLYDFTLRTGLRFAEVFGLTPSDVDFKKHLIDINKTMDYKFDLGSFAPTKNKSSNRVITVDKKAERDLWMLIFDVKQDESIFLNGMKRYYLKKLHKNLPKISAIQSPINSHLANYCKEAGIDPISFHKLRHIHASILIAKGVSVQSVADRLGHADTNTTTKYYIHILQSMREKESTQAREILNSMGGF